MFFIFTPNYDAILKKTELNSKYFTQFLIVISKKDLKPQLEMNNLETRIKRKLSEHSMTIQRLATESGVSEPTLHAIFNRGDAKLSQLEKIARALDTTLSFLLNDESQPSATQVGDHNQSGTANVQKIKASKAPSQELAAELAACQRELEVTRALVAAKDETITLLRATYNRPN